MACALRRRVAMFERPVQSVRRARPAWHIHAPYDPSMVVWLREIFRVWRNWLWRSANDGRTPAERVGLVQSEVRRPHAGLGQARGGGAVVGSHRLILPNFATEGP